MDGLLTYISLMAIRFLRQISTNRWQALRSHFYLCGVSAASRQTLIPRYAFRFARTNPNGIQVSKAQDCFNQCVPINTCLKFHFYSSYAVPTSISDLALTGSACATLEKNAAPQGQQIPEARQAKEVGWLYLSG